ncbi:MAG: PspA/IM30 family protein [Spirochaetales bacterium]|nr:PspA/IM30 family protein [Spirochaetales bacterium]MDY2815168.1 PspA/IM30 family protein [Bullifex sp.]
MGVFSRFKDIVNANINALLDKAEDPEKMLKLMMQEMEDTLIELKSNCAARMASRIRLERRIEEQKALISRWQSRAELAVDKGRDDLARDALIEKKKELATLSSLMKDLDSYSEIIDQSKAEINQLEDKLSQAKLKLKSLQEKARAAEAEALANERLKRNTESHFDDLESIIDRINAENELNRPSRTTADKFRDLEEQEEIEKELEALKKGRE